MTFPLDDMALPFSGTVLRPFPFHFNFPVDEVWLYQTDVITANDGTEQRISVRNPARPRRGLRVEVVAFERDEAQHLESVLFGWNRYTYGVPLWQDAMVLAEDTVIGDTALTVLSADGRDLVQRLLDEEDVPCLLWRAHDDWEPFLLADGAGTTVNTTAPVARVWPKYQTLVVPLQLMLLPEEVQVTRHTRAAAVTTLEFVSGQVPLTADPDCVRTGEDADPAVRVQMVRGTGGMSFILPSFTDYHNGMAGVSRPVPICGDGGPYDLFGLTTAAAYGLVAFEDPAAPLVNGGLDTDLALCTRKAPAEFREKVTAYGMSDMYGEGFFLCVFGTLPDGTVVSGEGGMFEVGSTFAGSGCVSGPGAPTARYCRIVMGSMAAGLAKGTAESNGDVVSSYGLYDISAPGGIATHTLINAEAFGSRVAKFNQGYCIRVKGTAAYKGVKMVVEDVLNPTDPSGSWTYATPEITTHDFTTGDRADDVAGIGAFVKALAFGSNIIGGAHDGDIGTGPAGYGTAFDDEWARVTVYLYKDDMVDLLQWQDHFKPMWVSMDMVT